MLTQIQIDYLKVEDIPKLDLDSLNNEQVLAHIEELGEDDRYLHEPMAAREFYESLQGFLEKFKPQIQGTEKGQRLQKILVKMMWQALPALDKKLKQRILSDDLLFALENQVDVLSNLDAYLYIFEYGVGPDNEERRIFGYSLDQNQERLGVNTLKLKSGQEVLPYLSNWIKDYVSYTDPKSFKGESYEVTQYLYSSPNVKNLTSDQKTLLTRVLAIYNHLRHPKYMPEIIGGPGSAPAPKAPAPAPRVPAPAAPIAPKSPVVPAAPVKIQASEFDKKLAQVSATPASSAAHGQTLEVLKHKLEERGVDVAPTHGAVQPLPSKVRLTPQEIQREVSTPELPKHQTAPIPAAPKPVMAAPKPTAPPAIRPPSAPQPSSLKPISVLDDLKKLDVSFLRQAPLPSQIVNLKSAIINIAHGNKVLPFYAVNAFEQSPLFQAYLSHGSSRFEGSGVTDNLSQQEFEALADLRKELERL